MHAEVSAFGDDNPFSILAADGDRGMPQESLVADHRSRCFWGVASVWTGLLGGTRGHHGATSNLDGVLRNRARQSGRLGQRHR